MNARSDPIIVSEQALLQMLAAILVSDVKATVVQASCLQQENCAERSSVATGRRSCGKDAEAVTKKTAMTATNLRIRNIGLFLLSMKPSINENSPSQTPGRHSCADLATYVINAPMRNI